MYVCMSVFMRVWVRAYIYLCVCVRAYIHLCVCVRACMRVCLRACVREIKVQCRVAPVCLRRTWRSRGGATAESGAGRRCTCAGSGYREMLVTPYAGVAQAAVPTLGATHRMFKALDTTATQQRQAQRPNAPLVQRMCSP
jgi:hypothetical protein